jgi:hypothetical protein
MTVEKDVPFGSKEIWRNRGQHDVFMFDPEILWDT